MPMDDILDLSEKIPEFVAARQRRMKTCHGCNNKGTDMISCDKCEMVYYCNAVST